MSDQTNIFTDEHKEETPPANTSLNTPDFSDLLGQIVNEKGEQKYKTVQDALYGLKHAQEYIPSLKHEKEDKDKEIETLRERVEQLSSLEQTVLELTREKEKPGTTVQSLNEEDIANLVRQTLTKTQSEATQIQNIQIITSTLREKFGDKAENVFYDKAKELGLTVDEMNALAAKTPKAVLTMLGISGEGVHKQPGFTPTTSSVNTSGFKPAAESFVGSSVKKIMLGATTQDLQEESENARKMVEELHNQGLSVHDLADPKIFFKQFK